MLKKWLTTYKFKDWTIHSDGSAVTQEEKEQRALEIASKLSDNIYRKILLHKMIIL